MIFTIQEKANVTKLLVFLLPLNRRDSRHPMAGIAVSGVDGAAAAQVRLNTWGLIG